MCPPEDKYKAKTKIDLLIDAIESLEKTMRYFKSQPVATVVCVGTEYDINELKRRVTELERTFS